MSGHAVTLLILAFISSVAIFSKRRFLQNAAAIMIFAFQAFLLLISFDGAARSVMEANQVNGPQVSNYENGVRDLKDALIPFRFLILGGSATLMILVLCRSSAQK